MGLEGGSQQAEGLTSPASGCASGRHRLLLGRGQWACELDSEVLPQGTRCGDHQGLAVFSDVGWRPDEEKWHQIAVPECPAVVTSARCAHGLVEELCADKGSRKHGPNPTAETSHAYLR